MNKIQINASKNVFDRKILIDGKPVFASAAILQLDTRGLPTLAISIPIVTECEVEGEAEIKINAAPVSDEIGRKVYEALKERYEGGKEK